MRDDDIFGGLLGLREALAPYLACGVALEPESVAVLVATLDYALDAYETEKKEAEFDSLVRRSRAFLAGQGIGAVGVPAACGNVVPLHRRRAPAPVSPSSGGDAA